MRVLIHNIIYDITTFINEHPGGPEVFSDADIVPDLTQRFNEVGHSEYAVNLLGNYKVEELSEDDPRFNRYNKLEYNKTKISKLVTHEDKFHIHKIMGLVSLLNYFYLLFDFFYSGATADITLRKVDGGFIGLTWVHSILSLSALQFLIPRTRTGILPMIWQEFRAHSIVFAVRSFLIINALYFFTDGPSGPSGSGLAVRFAIVLLAMKMADVSTEHLRENKKETTTATMPYWSDCPATLQSAIKYFYTHSQFMATIVCLFGKIPYILAVAFPIQIASFLMTLVRKNIISAFWYHVFYGGSLLIVYLINAADIALYPVVLTGFALIYARINLKINKYVLWTIVASASVSVGAVTVTGLLFYSIDVIFDKQHIREESNHRVQKNMTIRRDDDCDRPCDGSGIYREIVIQLCEKYSKYKPGMYFNLYFDTKKRPYTPVEYAATTGGGGGGGDRATFLIKRVETGEVSPLICDKYLVNQTVFVKGPFGMKYYDPSPGVESFVCDTVKISAKYIVMCSCGSGITPFYSMGVAWTQSETRKNGVTGVAWTQSESESETRNQELHYLSSYHLREDAVLRIRPSTTTTDSSTTDSSTTDSSTTGTVKERLYISNENTKLTPAALIDYLTGLIENSDETTRPEDIAVFICGTPTYSQMVKDACAIVSTELKWYEW
jgi:ferredoxin-NADP reductase/lipid-A-disaccharide synthase-like uncharacterized protein